ncbi:MAG: hypothetical protein WBA51_14315 [Erythrobacter sp.]
MKTAIPILDWKNLRNAVIISVCIPAYYFSDKLARRTRMKCVQHPAVRSIRPATLPQQVTQGFDWKRYLG